MKNYQNFCEIFMLPTIFPLPCMKGSTLSAPPDFMKKETLTHLFFPR